MQKILRHCKDTSIAILLITAIIYSTMLLSLEAVNSPLYRQSRIVSMLVQQDTVGIPELLTDTRHIKMLVQFAGALTSAYINFELIPVGEAPAFVAVFESLPDGVDISGFEYRRKDLHIYGAAETKAGYEAFLDGLNGRNHFASVSGRSYGATDDRLRFQIVCSPNISDTYPAY